MAKYLPSKVTSKLLRSWSPCPKCKVRVMADGRLSVRPLCKQCLRAVLNAAMALAKYKDETALDDAIDSVLNLDSLSFKAFEEVVMRMVPVPTVIQVPAPMGAAL